MWQARDKFNSPKYSDILRKSDRDFKHKFPLVEIGMQSPKDSGENEF